MVGITLLLHRTDCNTGITCNAQSGAVRWSSRLERVLLGETLHRPNVTHRAGLASRRGRKGHADAVLDGWVRWSRDVSGTTTVPDAATNGGWATLFGEEARRTARPPARGLVWLVRHAGKPRGGISRAVQAGSVGATLPHGISGPSAGAMGALAAAIL